MSSSSKALAKNAPAEAEVQHLALDRDQATLATGTDSEALQIKQLIQLVVAVPNPTGASPQEVADSLLPALESIAPQDSVEGMLAAQMVATHNAAMECFRRAFSEGLPLALVDMYLKQATKLQQIYARQVEALGKHRGKGQQKITIEHVTVQAGGQAVVGNVAAPALSAPEGLAATPLSLEDRTGDLVPLPDTPLAPVERARRSSRKKLK